jgi:outer membrane protein assembly factor BamB
VAPHGNPPAEWSETSNVRWKVKIPGDSTATPVIWGDQLFLISAIKTDRLAEEPAAKESAEKDSGAGKKQDKPDDAKEEKKDDGGKAKEKASTGGRTASRYGIKKPNNYYQFAVSSLDRHTGQMRWQHIAKEAVPHEGHHPDGSYASASPTTDGQRLYVSFGSRGVYCYDLAGNQLWTRDLGRMKISFTFGEGCSPVIHGDSVIMNWDHQDGSFLIVLDAKTGETKWRVDRDETTTWATPLVVEHDGKTQVIVSGIKRVRSYDLANGEVIWACSGLMPTAIPSPVSDGKNVYCMTGFMGSALYAFPLDSTGDMTEDDRANIAKIAWKRKQPGTPYVPSPLLDGELLYFTASNKGILSCLNAPTGEPIIDRQRIEGIENIYASPVAAADHIYLSGREGLTVVIKRGEFDRPAAGTDAKPKAIILHSNQLDDRFDASPAVVGDSLYLRGRENLYCISK